MTILDKSSKNKMFLEILDDYNGVCLKIFQRIEEKSENASWDKYSIFSEFRNLKKRKMEFCFINRCR